MNDVLILLYLVMLLVALEEIYDRHVSSPNGNHSANVPGRLTCSFCYTEGYYEMLSARKQFIHHSERQAHFCTRVESYDSVARFLFK